MYNEQRTPDELLHAYIDAELSPELEQQFFAILASDGELRARLRELRGIRAEARRFGAVAAPPPELTSAVFERLGFTSSASLRPSHLAGAALLFRNAWAPLASAAAAAILTATIIFGLQGSPSDGTLPALAERQPATVTAPRPDTRAAATDESLRGTPQTPTRDAANSDVRTANSDVRTANSDVRAADALRDGSSGQRAAVSRIPATAAVPATPASGDRSPDAAAVSPTIAATDIPNDRGMDTKDAGQQAHTDNQAADGKGSPPFDEGAPVHIPGGGWIPAPAVPLSADDASVMAQQGLAGQEVVDTRRFFPSLSQEPVLNFLSIELRGVSAASFPNVTIGARSNPWMADMAAAVYYSDEQDDFGLEYGQEPFSQHYHGIENGKTVFYEQNLLTSWFLLGYRHRFMPVHALGSIEPYVTTSFGATMQAWPLARAGFGVMYMPDRRVRFHLGLEGSLLAYPYQDTWFTSKRAGLTYGISILL